MLGPELIQRAASDLGLDIENKFNANAIRLMIDVFDTQGPDVFLAVTSNCSFVKSSARSTERDVQNGSAGTCKVSGHH